MGLFMGNPMMGRGFEALAVTRTPTAVTGGLEGAGTAYSSSTTVTAAGGSGNYSYSWSLSPAGATVSSPTSRTTTFQATLGNGESYNGTATCRVTDTSTGEYVDVTVAVSIVSNYDYPPITAELSPSDLVVLTGGPYPIAPSGNWSLTLGGGSGSFSVAWNIWGGEFLTSLSADASGISMSQTMTAAGQSKSTNMRLAVTDTVSGETAIFMFMFTFYSS